MNREKTLVRNTIILAVGTFFPKLAIFIALPVLTANLSKADYGTYELVLTLVALILPAATLQIHSAAFRYLIDVPHDEDEKTSIITNIFAFVLPTSLAALIIMYFALHNYTPVIRLAICAYLLCDIIVNANRQIIRGLQRNIDYAASAIISSVGQVVLTFVLLLGTKSGLLGALLALGLAELITSVYLFSRGKILHYINPAKISWEKLKELLGYSWPMVPNSLSQWVMHASDKLIITWIMGLSANAVFSIAYKIPSILSFAQTTFNMAWQENASVASKDDDVNAYYSSMFSWLFDIVAGCMAILIGFTPLLFNLFVKGDYAEAYNHMPILFMGMLFFTLSTFWGGVFVAFKKTTSVGLTTVAAAVIHLVIVLAGIHWFGLYAASVATLVGYILLCVFRAIGVQKIIKLSYNWKRIGIVCALLAAQCVVCFLQITALDIINFVFGAALCILLNRQIITSMSGKVMRKLGLKPKKN